MWANQQPTGRRDLIYSPSFIAMLISYYHHTLLRGELGYHRRLLKGPWVKLTNHGPTNTWIEVVNWRKEASFFLFHVFFVFYGWMSKKKIWNAGLQRNLSLLHYRMIQVQANDGEFLTEYQTEDYKSLDRSTQTTVSCPLLAKRQRQERKWTKKSNLSNHRSFKHRSKTSELRLGMALPFQRRNHQSH